MTLPLLDVKAAVHAYGLRKVLHGVDLQLYPGEIYALLGPNGAGKSTLLRAVCGRLKLKGGTVSLFGADPRLVPDARMRLGLVPQDLALYAHLTIHENLQVFAALSGVPAEKIDSEVSRAMALTRTSDRLHVPVKHLSGGYQRRVNIAAAILHHPAVLVLDEPTVGVDIDARESVDTVIRDLRHSGVAVLMTTHDLDQAGHIADRVGFLKDGRLVSEGAPADLIRSAFGERHEIIVQMASDLDPAAEVILVEEGMTRRAGGSLWTVLDDGGYAAAGRLDQRLRQAGLAPQEIRVRQPSLQNLFNRVVVPS